MATYTQSHAPQGTNLISGLGIDIEEHRDQANAWMVLPKSENATSQTTGSNSMAMYLLDTPVVVNLKNDLDVLQTTTAIVKGWNLYPSTDTTFGKGKYTLALYFTADYAGIAVNWSIENVPYDTVPTLPADFSALNNNGDITGLSQGQVLLRKNTANSRTPITNDVMDANLELLRQKLNSIGVGNNVLKKLFGSTKNAAQSYASAEIARIKSVEAQGLSETARQASELAQQSSESARDSSINAKNASVTAQQSSEAARDASVSAKDTAVSKATAASQSATSAATSATTATTQATNAATSASTATTKANAAATSANSAAASATHASTEANKVSTLKVQTGAVGSNASYNASSGVLTIPRGDKGAKGAKGDRPSHQWSGYSIRFLNANGSWGSYKNIRGAKGDPGPVGATFSVSGKTLTITT